MPTPEDKSFDEFDMFPITPSLVKGILKSRSSGSSPGDDGISYHHASKKITIYTLFFKVGPVSRCEFFFGENCIGEFQ